MNIPRKNLTRIAGVIGGILMIPLVMTLIGDRIPGNGWHWGFFDFIVMGALMFGTGLALDFAWRKLVHPVHQVLACVAIVVAFLMLWVELAVDGVSRFLERLF